MRLSTFLYSLLPTVIVAQGAGDLCTVSTGDHGICESTDWCIENNGIIYSGLCPDGPSYVKCCYVPECDGSIGRCSSTSFSECSDMGGHFVRNLCPGPSNYECCVE